MVEKARESILIIRYGSGVLPAIGKCLSNLLYVAFLTMYNTMQKLLHCEHLVNGRGAAL